MGFNLRTYKLSQGNKAYASVFTQHDLFIHVSVQGKSYFKCKCYNFAQQGGQPRVTIMSISVLWSAGPVRMWCGTTCWRRIRTTPRMFIWWTTTLICSPRWGQFSWTGSWRSVACLSDEYGVSYVNTKAYISMLPFWKKHLWVFTYECSFLWKPTCLMVWSQWRSHQCSDVLFVFVFRWVRCTNCTGRHTTSLRTTLIASWLHRETCSKPHCSS